MDGDKNHRYLQRECHKSLPTEPKRTFRSLAMLSGRNLFWKSFIGMSGKVYTAVTLSSAKMGSAAAIAVASQSIKVIGCQYFPFAERFAITLPILLLA